jgi:hypothetical protein
MAVATERCIATRSRARTIVSRERNNEISPGNEADEPPQDISAGRRRREHN